MNKGIKAGCGMSSCGCLMILLALPLAIVIALAIGGDSIDWSAFETPVEVQDVD